MREAAPPSVAVIDYGMGNLRSVAKIVMPSCTFCPSLACGSLRAACGGLRCARQVDAIARAAGMDTMVSCLIEPALLISAGLSFALSSPNVRYADLDGHLDLLNDPSVAGFSLQEGWLVASDGPGLGCKVRLG